MLDFYIDNWKRNKEFVFLSLRYSKGSFNGHGIFEDMFSVTFKEDLSSLLAILIEILTSFPLASITSF